ncbi:uncharacterized protein LOC112268580 [Brachypodium distachyon]|uniref:uncharacterized protein LOC112268580 n=1 Tax=Brachypodium distachyon TaxID=15368 RepID=UPI000D0CC5C3|nr:uncharacterized protein LOC112268580 [Brachypodium distachyon]|eukprot:XP_024311255.1 uncharacterized protein LOC112268580 [Brachypodium distachyon]
MDASLANLEKLTVFGESVGQHVVEMVGRIPNLLEFTVPSVLEPVVISSSNSGGFQQLQMFKFILCAREFMFEAGAMSNVRKLYIDIRLKEIKSASGGRCGFDDIGIQHLSCLAELEVAIDCRSSRAADVQVVEVSFESMVKAHSNHPSLEMWRYGADEMLKDNDVLTRS